MQKRILRNVKRCQYARCKRPAVAQAPKHDPADPDEPKGKRYCTKHAFWWSQKNPHMQIGPLEERRRWRR